MQFTFVRTRTAVYRGHVARNTQISWKQVERRFDAFCRNKKNLSTSIYLMIEPHCWTGHQRVVFSLGGINLEWRVKHTYDVEVDATTLAELVICEALLQTRRAPIVLVELQFPLGAFLAIGVFVRRRKILRSDELNRSKCLEAWLDDKRVSIDVWIHLGIVDYDLEKRRWFLFR